MLWRPGAVVQRVELTPEGAVSMGGGHCVGSMSYPFTLLRFVKWLKPKNCDMLRPSTVSVPWMG